MHRLLRHVLLAGIVTVFNPALSWAQQATSVPEPAFESVSIHPTHVSMGCFSMLPPGGTHYAVTCETLRNMIMLAYGTTYIEGGGKALDTYYDLRASTGEKPWTLESIRPMMRHFLEQRFHLVVRDAKSERSGYRLLIAKGGPKMPLASPESIPKGHKAGEPAEEFIYPGHAQGRGLEANGIASLLSAILHAPVTDATGLNGIFNVDLSYAPDNSTKSNLPSFFTAVEEQLGLKLQPAKVMVDTVVIDHVDAEPTPN